MIRNRRFSADALRRARAAAGLSRPELSQLLHLSVASIKAWETGRRTPSPSAQLRLAESLGMSYGDLELPSVHDHADIRRVREALGMTQAQAAGELGIEVWVLKQIEDGQRLPPDPGRMRRAYGLTHPELAAVMRRTVPESGGR